MNKLPPTKGAPSMLQHTRGAVYQAGIWTTSTQTQQMVSAQDFGWSSCGEIMGSSVDYYSRGFEIMQGIAEMHLQRRLLKLHMWQS